MAKAKAKTDGIQEKLEQVRVDFDCAVKRHVGGGGSLSEVQAWNYYKIPVAIFTYLESNYIDIYKEACVICPNASKGKRRIELTPPMVELCYYYAVTQFKKELFVDDGELSRVEHAKIARFCKSFNTIFNTVNNSFEKAVIAFINDNGESSASKDINLTYYHKLAESAVSNRFMRSLSLKITDPAQLDIYGNALIEGKENDTRLFVEGYSELARKPQQSAAMLVDVFMIKATENGMKDTLIRLPLEEYMSMRGLSDEKSARIQADLDLEALKRIKFMYKKKIGKRNGDWLEVRLSGGTTGQIRGELVFRFNQDFYDSFKATGTTGRTQFMYFPREALQGSINDHPWKYWLGRKISELKRINLGKPNEDINRVKTLIEACPDYPTYEHVMGTGKHVQQQIIDPFERDMDTFTTFTWNYTGEQPQDYNSFIESNVQIVWHNYPDCSELVKTREQYQKHAANKQNKRAKSSHNIS